MKRSNRYWAQESTQNGVSSEYAISPIFNTKQALLEWVRDARKQGRNAVCCAEKAPCLRINC